MELGTYQLLSNAVLFVPMLIWGRRYIGVGSIVNMVLAGYAVQGASAVFAAVLPAVRHPALVTVLFVIGIGVFALGASLYMTAALGTAPYDALAPMIVDGTNAKYRLVRVLQDVLFLVLAIVFRARDAPGGIGLDKAGVIPVVVPRWGVEDQPSTHTSGMIPVHRLCNR